MVIVDPVTDTVIAQACMDNSHPLKHPTMLCLDKVATLQGGGAWNKTGNTCGGDTVSKSERQLNKEAVKGHSECPPLKRAKLQYLCIGYDAYCTVEPCVM